MTGMGPNPEVTYPASYEYPGARQFSYDPDLAKYFESHNMDRYPLNITNEQNTNSDCFTIKAKSCQNDSVDLGKGRLSCGETSGNVSLTVKSESVAIPGICDDEKDNSAASTFLGDKTMSNIKLFDIPLLGKSSTDERKFLMRECTFRSEEETRKCESWMQGPSKRSLPKEVKDVSLPNIAIPGTSGSDSSCLGEGKAHYHVKEDEVDGNRKSTHKGRFETAGGFPNETFGESSLIACGKIDGESSTKIEEVSVNKKEATPKEISLVPKALEAVSKVEESLKLVKKPHEEVKKEGLSPHQRVAKNSSTQEGAKEKSNLCRGKKQHDRHAVSGKPDEVNLGKLNRDVKNIHSKQSGVESSLSSLKPSLVKIPVDSGKKLTEHVNVSKQVRSLSESSCSSEKPKIEKSDSKPCLKQSHVSKKEETGKVSEKKLKTEKLLKDEKSKSSHTNLVSKTLSSVEQSPQTGKAHCERIEQGQSVGKKTKDKERKNSESHHKKHSERKKGDGKKEKGEKNKKPVSANEKHDEAVVESKVNSESKKNKNGGDIANVVVEVECAAEMNEEGNDGNFGTMIIPVAEGGEEILTNESGELYLMQEDFIQEVLADAKSESNDKEQEEGFMMSDGEVEDTLEERKFPTKEELLCQKKVKLPKNLDEGYKVPEYMNPVVLADKLYVIPGCFRYSPGLIDMVLAKTMKYKERYLRKLARREEGRKGLEVSSCDSHSVESGLKTGEQVSAAEEHQSWEKKCELIRDSSDSGEVGGGKDESSREENIEQNEVDTTNVNTNVESASKRFFSLQIDDFERRFLVPKPE